MNQLGLLVHRVERLAVELLLDPEARLGAELVEVGPIPARWMREEESQITMGMPNVVRQIGICVVAGNPALAQELFELPSAHLCEDPGLSER